jgi:folate-dependent phosphoribosylglycinamide formyltransferase PurN
MRIGFLCGGTLGDFERTVIELVDDSFDSKIVLGIIDNRYFSLISRVKKHLKRGRGGYIFLMAIKYLFQKQRPHYSSNDWFRDRDIPVVVTRDVYSKNTLHLISENNIDVLCLIGGFGIIKRSLLEIANYGVLSYHHGDMRYYRGMPPAFWELYHGETRMGVTVQRLSIGLDKGVPIIEMSVPIHMNDTLRSLRNRAFSMSTNMMTKAIGLLKTGEFQYLKQYGPLYTIPNFRQWTVLNIKIFFRHIRFYLARIAELIAVSYQRFLS